MGAFNAALDVDQPPSTGTVPTPAPAAVADANMGETAAAPVQGKGNWLDNLLNNSYDSMHGGAANAEVETAATEQNVAANAAAHPIISSIGSDVAALALAPAEIIAHPLKTLTDAVTTPEHPIGGATLASVENLFDPAYWKQHPLLNIVSAAGLVTGAGGIITSLGARAATAGAVSDIAESTAAHVAAGEITPGYASTATSVLTPKLVGQVVDHIAAGKDTSIAAEMINNALLKKGFDPQTASIFVKNTLEAVGDNITQNSGQLKTGQFLAHPVQALAGLASPGASAAVRSVFSAPESSAVAHLYGDEAVTKDPAGFSQIEDWASKQVTERGLPDNINNRIAVMNEWTKENPEWAALTPEERVQYQQNYIKATEYQQTLNESTGDVKVPTRALSPSDVNAAIQTIEGAPEHASAGELLDILEETLGPKIGNFRKTIEAAVASNPSKEGMVDAITSLARKGSLLYKNSDEASALALKMEEETGYKPAIPPKGKPLSFATRTPGAGLLMKDGSAAAPTITSDATLGRLVTAKSRLQKLTDAFGLSINGVSGSGLDAMYADQFAHNFIADFGKKYENGIQIPHTFVTKDMSTEAALGNVGSKTVPLDGLYSFLDRNMDKINAAMGRKGFSAKMTVGELTAADLEKFGIPKDAAADIAAAARKSLALPISKTGLAEGIVNYAKAHLPGFNTYYNAYLKAHFNLSPFFAARVWAKTNILRMYTTGQFAINFGDKIVPDIVRNAPFVKYIVAPETTNEEAAIMANTFWRDISPSSFDVADSPEVLSFQRNSNIRGSMASRQAFLNLLGYNVKDDSVVLAKGLAAKYGMSLREVSSYTLKDGARVYNNPSTYNAIRDAIEATYAYKPGFLTSPMARTLNVVWFPFRFEAKVVGKTASWMANLSPVVRSELMLNMSYFAGWSQSPEGQAWVKKNKNGWDSALSYLLPYGEIGQSVNSALQGKLFNGDLGEVGGIPFAFPLAVMKNLSLLPSAFGETDNPLTGKPSMKTTPKNLVSSASAETVFEDFFTTFLPSFPIYSFFGGGVTPAGQVEHSYAEGTYAEIQALFTGSTEKKVVTPLNKEFKNVKSTYTRY